jgi:hypothetical protein
MNWPYADKWTWFVISGKSFLGMNELRIKQENLRETLRSLSKGLRLCQIFGWTKLHTRYLMLFAQ